MMVSLNDYFLGLRRILGVSCDLDKRQSDNNAKWYEYGRSQALSGLNRQKLLISTVVTNDVDVYELEQECIPYAGNVYRAKGR